MAAVTRAQVVFDTEINPDWTPTLATAPTELVLTEPMPGLCSEHGFTAIETRSFAVNSSGPLSELPTPRAMLRSMKRGRRDPVLARVRFDCPACEFCLHEVRRFRRIALLALLAIPLAIAAVLIVRALELEPLYLPLAFVIVPGCMPIALLVAMLSWSRSRYFADVWMNETADQLIVFAHPDFVAAVEQNRAGNR
ncbi:hypothetical protein [Nocardia sp. NPDC057440]|uniref:hypothetical protein n=1 Tax=Nocardia sp. NPDC057440 TaxID=3346134 RepID=UPI0036712152